MYIKVRQLRSCVWKAGTVAMVGGFILTAGIYSYLAERKMYFSRTITTTPGFVLTQRNFDLKPPLIYLTYGYIEPSFNPKTIDTLLGHKCITTTNHELMNVSDAVVIRFNHAFKSNAFTKPVVRRSEQLYVYFSLEPPWPFLQHDFSFVDKNFFNWTMTYRRDSDVFYPYAALDRVMTKGRDQDQRPYYGDEVVERILGMKTSKFPALLVISRCGGGDGPVHRIKYAMALEKAGLGIEKRGGCFQNRYSSPWNSDEFREFSVTFKFFLAFENGYHCRDYVTEKTWRNSLRAGTVPVIWGAPKSDVVKLIPEGSFIHTDDFANPTELANYLNYLHSNMTAYSAYFRWRRNASDSALKHRDDGFRQLCNKLWENRIYGNGSKVYLSFKDWYIGQDNPECFKIQHPKWE